MGLNEVINGLKQGKSFERAGTSTGGGKYVEKLIAVSAIYFKHQIVGAMSGHGWGGSSQLEINILNNGRWDEDGWKEIAPARGEQS